MTGVGCVIVVGHGPGVGEATARAFAAAGHPVALIARNGDKARLAAQALSTPSTPAGAFAGDAGDEASLTAALAAAGEAMGPPAVLVYNAAHWRPGPVLALGASDFEADYRTCVVGALLAAKWAAPLMRANGGGSILFTGGGLAMHRPPVPEKASVEQRP